MNPHVNREKGPATSMITVRDATERDLPGVRDIYSFYVLNSLAAFDEQPPDLNDMRSKYLSIREKNLPFLVVQIAGEVAGYTYVTPYRGRSAHRFSLENSIYVRQDKQGSGLGKAMLCELVSRCEALGYRQLIAIVGDSENTASIRLHSSLGFKQIGILYGVGFKLGKWVNTVIMQRQLGEGLGSLPSSPLLHHSS